MSLDTSFIYRIIQQNSLIPAHEGGITARHFEGTDRDVWSFVVEYYQQFNQAPSLETITQKFGVEIPESAESIEFLVIEIRKRRLQKDLNELSHTVDKSLSGSEPDKALEIIRSFLKEQDERTPSKNSVTMGQMIDPLIQDYQDAKAGKMGIPTFWERINEWTMGWWPGDLSFISGRLGSGKSFFLILLAIAARLANHKVLFISGEMNQRDVARRYASICAKLPYSALRKGRLTEDYEQRYMQYLERSRADTDFHICDSSGGFRSTDVEIMIDKSKCDLILIDASYRIRSNQKSRDRFENMAMVADDLKAYATKYNIPIVATTQLNRESTKKKDLGSDDIALSDVVGWNATNLFALKQTDEDRQNGVMGIYPLKVREGENIGKAFVINWNMRLMDFTAATETVASTNDRRMPKEDGEMPW